MWFSRPRQCRLGGSSRDAGAGRQKRELLQAQREAFVFLVHALSLSVIYARSKEKEARQCRGEVLVLVDREVNVVTWRMINR
jgi:hypothetical protein